MAIYDALQGLEWPARRRVAGRWAGHHAAISHGRAPELAGYRAYRSGDDARDLDWKLLARRDRAYVRLSHDRATHPTWFVLDASASMAWPSPGFDKWRCACDLVRGLAWLALRGGDAVALEVAGAAPRSIAPTSRRDVLPHLDQLLGEGPPAGTARVAAAVERVPARTRLVIVSDLLDDGQLPGVGRGWLSAGGELILLHVVSRSERELPPGVAAVRDPEVEGPAIPVDDDARRSYHGAVAAWLANARDTWQQAGAAYHLVDAEGDPLQAIREVVAAADRERIG